MVGGADDVGVVFDDEDGVAEVAEVVEDPDEAFGIAGMEADGGFIEDVAGADEAGTEASGELDALGFAAGEGGGEAVESEVFKADAIKEFEALLDFDEDLSGDGGGFGGELEGVEEVVGLGDVEADDLGDGLAGEAEVEGFGAKAGAFTGAAIGVAAVAGEEDADVDFVLLLFDLGEEAVDGFDDGGLVGGREIFVGGIEGDIGDEVDAPVVVGFGPGIDGAVVEGAGGVGDDEGEVVIDGIAEALTGGAGALGVIEGEEGGFGDGEFEVALAAGEALGEADAGGFGFAGLFEEDFAGFAVAEFDGIDDALHLIGADDEAVGEDEDGLGEVEVEEGFGGGEFEGLPVLEEAGKTALAEVEEVVAEFGGVAGVGGFDGEEGVPAGAFGLGEHLAGDGVDGIAFDVDLAVGAPGLGGAGEEEAEVVVDFGGGGDGGAGVAGGIFLADGDGWGEAVDVIDIGFLHAVEELAGVGRERLDVAALALGVDGVEDEGGLAGPGDAGDDGQPVMRQVEIDVFEVMDPRAADPEQFIHTKYLCPCPMRREGGRIN